MARNQRTVFILGAGASAEAGGPLMWDFLDRARGLWRAQPGAHEETVGLVFRAIGELQRTHSKANIDIHNFEKVFAAFEMAGTLGKFGDFTAEEIKKLPPAMRSVIVLTLEETVRFPFRRDRVHPPPPYDDFVSLLKRLTDRPTAKHEVAVLTFNYDVGLDFALESAGQRFTYGFNEDKGAVPLLKLHGSLNWARCAECGKIHPARVGQYMQNTTDFRRFELSGDRRPSDIVVHIGSRPMETLCCGETRRREPVIVPPTWNKVSHYEQVATVWAHAAEALSEAENIVVVGYSLPPTDEFFRYLYALGTVGNAPLERFLVVDPDSDAASRFSELLGPGAEQRFQHIKKSFGEALGRLEDELLT